MTSIELERSIAKTSKGWGLTFQKTRATAACEKMTASPEAMVLLFDAVMIDDDALLRSLFRRFPLMRKKASELTHDERDILSPAALMTNHFYTYPTSDEKKVKFGLVVADTACR